MSTQLHLLLTLLKQSSHNIRHLAQIFTQTITTGFITKTLTWNYIIRSYTKSSTPITAIHIYNHYSTPTDNHTYPTLFKACTLLGSLPKGMELHAHVTKKGYEFDSYISNSLIHFYGCMGEHEYALMVFDQMSDRDLVTWNILLGTYRDRLEGLCVFKEMVKRGVGVDGITILSVLSVCSQVGERGVEYGRAIHGYALKVGIQGLNMRNALLSMYVKGGCIDVASPLMEEGDVVSDMIMINGFVEMGLMDRGRKIFDRMVFKDVVVWNSMINGYVKVERPKEALELFEAMEKNMVRPDENTMVSLLSACASLSDLHLGRLVHRYILQRRIKRDVVIGTALFNMYAKCGSLEEALATFYKMENKDVFAWTAVITGAADYGYANEAINMFKKMENNSMKPNGATFVSILMACSRSGLVEEGCLLFDRMVEVYKIQPRVEHIGCLVDLLSKAGVLFRAENFIHNMAPHERVVGYKTLLVACISYSDIDLGERIAKKLIELKPDSHGDYVLLSNFYALADWEKVMEMRRIMKDMGMRKEVGISFV